MLETNYFVLENTAFFADTATPYLPFRVPSYRDAQRQATMRGVGVYHRRMRRFGGAQHRASRFSVRKR